MSEHACCGGEDYDRHAETRPEHRGRTDRVSPGSVDQSRNLAPHSQQQEQEQQDQEQQLAQQEQEQRMMQQLEQLLVDDVTPIVATSELKELGHDKETCPQKTSLVQAQCTEAMLRQRTISAQVDAPPSPLALPKMAAAGAGWTWTRMRRASEPPTPPEVVEPEKAFQPHPPGFPGFPIGSVPSTSPILDASLQHGTDARSIAWETTLEHAIKAVVSIHVKNVRPFDTDRAGIHQGTGFVVDKERGLILTNRHIVGPGPIAAKVIFSDYEEVAALPVYRDPIHDFGFFRFNPGCLKFMQCSEIQLNPEGARIGTEIRVVGNDAGEKLSILQGTLARLDRPAPEYGVGGYVDFNTFYYQAASGTSGGSSGSPVLNIHGQAIALNAGANVSSSQSFYLPLDRVERALRLLQQQPLQITDGSPSDIVIPRGTIQVQWHYAPFDEVRRLGLHRETEVLFRNTFPQRSGILTVSKVLAYGPAHRLLQHGDMLIRVEGQLTSHFMEWEAIVDDNIGNSITLEVQRGTTVLEVQVQVQDLHAITPSEYVELGDAVFNPLSYQMARHYPSARIGSVFVAGSGYAFSNANIHRKYVIVSVNRQETPDLMSFLRAWSNVAYGEEVVVKYFPLEPNKQRKDKSTTVTLDHFYPFRYAKRHDKLGTWVLQTVAPSGVDKAKQRGAMQSLNRPPGDVPLFRLDAFPANIVARAMVHIECFVPYRVDGVFKTVYEGIGVVVQSNVGLILTDYSVIPTPSTSIIKLTFFNGARTTGNIIFMHPFHNFVVLQYNTQLVPPISGTQPHGVMDVKLVDPFTGVDRAQGTSSRELEQRARTRSTNVSPHSGLGESTARDADVTLAPGSSVLFVGLSKENYEPLIRPTSVTTIIPFLQPPSMPPRFRSINAEHILIGNDPTFAQNQGVLVNMETGGVYALWCGQYWSGMSGETTLTYAGLPVSYVIPTLRSIVKYACGGSVGPASGSASFPSLPATSQQQQQQLQQLRSFSLASSSTFSRSSSTWDRNAASASLAAFPMDTNPLEQLRQAAIPQSTTDSPHIYAVQVELEQIRLDEAQSLGLSQEWKSRLARKSEKSCMLRVHTLLQPMREHTIQPEKGLKEGDLLLQVDGVIMTSLRDIQQRLAAWTGYQFYENSWSTLALRDGAECWCEIPIAKIPVIPGAMGHRRGAVVKVPRWPHALPPIIPPMLLGWCGGVLVHPSRYVLEQVIPDAMTDESLDLSQYPYIATIMVGSPLQAAGLIGGYFLMEMDGLSMADPRRDFSPLIQFISKWKFSHLRRRAVLGMEGGSGYRSIPIVKTAQQDMNGDSAYAPMVEVEDQCGQEFVRLKVCRRQGGVSMLSVRPDEHYWPSWVLAPSAMGSAMQKQ